MDNLPANIYSVAAVRETDRTTIEDHGVPGYTLMTRAGEAAVREARAGFPEARRWQVICGAGNNGGDGYVVARLAAGEGITVSVLSLVDPDRLAGDAATAYADFAAEGGVVVPWQGELDGQADLMVDAILGSGLEREVGGEFARAVAAINRHAAPVVALDIPTGIHGAPFFRNIENTAKLKPSEYFARQCYVAASFMGAHESALRHEIGLGNLMWGADFPHVEGTWPRTRKSLARCFAGIPIDEVRTILTDTPAALYGFDVDSLQPIADRVGPTAAELTGSA